MVPYRLYTLDENNRFIGSEDFQADTDEHAVAFGRWLEKGKPFELSCLDRFVHKEGTLSEAAGRIAAPV